MIKHAASGQIQGDEVDIDLSDGMMVCQFKIKVKITFMISGVSKTILNDKVHINQRNAYMISFQDVGVKNPEITANRKRTVANNELQKSEIYVSLQLGE